MKGIAEVKINKKQIILGGGLAALMLPVMFVGFVCRLIQAYFMVGAETCDIVFENVAEWIKK